MHRFTLDGVLKTVSPLHITDASRSARWNPDGNDGRGEVAQIGGFPLTLTRQATYLTGSNGGTKRETVPVIPATTWRGALRRGAFLVIRDHVTEDLNTLLSYQAYQGMRCGAVSGSPDKAPPTTEEILSARTHVFYGIFGGGPRLLAGGLKMRDSLPILESLIESEYLPERFADRAATGLIWRDLTCVTPVVRRDDFISDPDAASVVQDYDAIRSAWRSEVVRRAVEGKKDDDERGVRTLSYRQDMAAGLPLYFRLDLHGTTAQMGLLLAALERRLPDGIGGRSAVGLGRLSGLLSVSVDSGPAADALSIADGDVEFLPGAEPFISAMSEAVSALSLDDVNRYMLPAA